MRYDSSKIPQTLEELIEYGWVDLMRLHIKKYTLADINNSVEDILQDMFVQMLEYDYLAKYQSSGRPFEVYLVVFIRNFMAKRFKKENASRHGHDIIYAKSVDISQPDSAEDSDGSVVYLDKMEDKTSRFEDYTLLLESVRSDLAEFKANSSNVYEGVEYQRDPRTVFDLIEQGFSTKEIAKIFDTSPQFIYLLLKKIRGCKTLVDCKYSKA